MWTLKLIIKFTLVCLSSLFVVPVAMAGLEQAEVSALVEGNGSNNVYTKLNGGPTSTPTPYPTQIHNPPGYLEHFEWPFNQMANGWTSEDNSASITGDGDTRGILRKVVAGDSNVMSPVIIELDNSKHHTFEIKLDSVSEGADLDVQIQDVLDDNTQYIVFVGLDSPGIYYTRIDSKQYLTPLTIKLWMHEIIDNSEIAVDYVRIYARPASTFTPSPSVPSTQVPSESSYGSAFPNPFIQAKDGKTTISLGRGDTNTYYQIIIMNLRGQIVRKLENENEWNGMNDNGNLCEGGVYIYQIVKEGKKVSGKIILIK
jgi:hypothetical protein